MKKHRIAARSMAIIVSFIIFAILLIEYHRYVTNADVINASSIETHLQHIHTSAAQEFANQYKLNNNDLDATIASLDYKNFAYEAEIAIVKSDGDSRGEFLYPAGAYDFPPKLYMPKAKDFYEWMYKSYYYPDYNYSDFEYSYNAHEKALTCLYATEEKEYLYIYYAPTNFPVDIIVIARRDYVSSELIKLYDTSNRFISTLLVIVVIFTLWLIFTHFYNVITTKRDLDLHSSIQFRYWTVLAGSNISIWEYYPETDKMVWDSANKHKEPLVDISTSGRKAFIEQQLIHADDRIAFLNFCDDCFSDAANVSAEIRILSDDKTYRWHRLSGTKVFSQEGYIQSVIGQIIDIHEEKIENDALRAKAAQDSLTKLYNYSSFVELASKAIETNDSADIKALLIIDADDFNSLNEIYGYVFADAILVDIAGRIKKIFPSDSILGRFGGDEFVVFLNQVPSVNYVAELAEAFISSTYNVLDHTKSQYRFSCSVGAAFYPVDSNNYNDLFEKASMALYSSKQRGKGLFSVYQDDMEQLPDELRNKNKKKLNMPSTSSKEHSIVDSTIIVNAIDMLFDSKDIDFSISMMLSIIGIYFKLESMQIIQFTNDGKAFVSHEWCAEEHCSLPGDIKEKQFDKESLFTGFEKYVDKTFVSGDINTLEDCKLIESDPCLKGTRALLQYGIVSREKLAGYINIAYSNVHNWSKSEIDSLALLTKLIGSYLLQLNSLKTIDYVSKMDSLTDTYNLNTFIDKAGLQVRSNKDKSYAMAYINMLQFKLINGTYGYEVGDRLLTAIANILQENGEKGTLVSHISADRFAVLYPYNNMVDLLDQIRDIAAKIKHIPQPNGDYYKLIPLIGIYEIKPGDNIVEAVDRANIAVKNHIDYHNTNYIFYQESMQANLLEQHEISQHMEEALENNEFVAYYQPKIDLYSQQIIGSEALVRWVRPNGILGPDKFVPIFEENGFIVKLDLYILEAACKMLRKHLDMGVSPFPISVNFSRVHLNNTGLPAMIDVTLKRYNIPPELIQIELTESALSASNSEQFKILNAIHALGCKLAMDDFGSGMSSLNLLRELPFDILKIDKDFLHNKVMTQKERTVIRNVVRMAHELDMDVICEGVETSEQEAFLKSIGCHTAQGYLYSKPITEKEFFETYVKN